MKNLWMMAVLGMGLAGAVQGAEALRTISVTGEGMVEVEPDRAGVTFSVQKEALTAAEAKTEVDARVGDLLDLFDEMGIASNQVNTSRMSIAPMYNHHQGTRSFRGFNVSRQVVLTLKELGQLETLMEKAVQKGVTHVSPPTLTHSREKELKTEAYEKACAHAMANAEHLANQFGVRVGPVRRIEQEPGGSMGDPFGSPRVAMAFESGGGDRNTVRLGLIKIEVTVYTVFDLLVE